MSPRRLSAVAALVCVPLLMACAPDPLAGLDELPADAAARLAVVPNRDLVATTVRPSAPLDVPPPVDVACPKDFTITYYDAQVLSPVTVCPLPPVSQDRDSLPGPRGSDTEVFRLTDAGILGNLKGGALQLPPLVCTTNRGPWEARLTSTRACIGSCVPSNELVLIGAPNLVAFVWGGNALQSMPPHFEYAATPKQTMLLNLGDCHAGPSAMPDAAR